MMEEKMIGKDVWVFIETTGETISEALLRILSKAKEISNDFRLVAILLGNVNKSLVERLKNMAQMKLRFWSIVMRKVEFRLMILS